MSDTLGNPIHIGAEQSSVETAGQVHREEDESLERYAGDDEETERADLGDVQVVASSEHVPETVEAVLSNGGEVPSHPSVSSCHINKQPPRRPTRSEP
jgi:hypothetical protein